MLSHHSTKIPVASLADQTVLVPLIEAECQFDEIRFDCRKTTRALERLLLKRSFGRVWLLKIAREPAGYAILTFNYVLSLAESKGLSPISLSQRPTVA